MRLTDAAIRNAKQAVTPAGRVTDKPYKMGDGGGLYLEVTPTGGKWWRLKYRFGGKEKRIALGVYPNVSLESAREMCGRYREMLSEKQDPGEFHKQMRQAERDQRARKLSPTRFTLDHLGSLSITLGRRRVSLTPEETMELRAFLDATRAVPVPKEAACV